MVKRIIPVALTSALILGTLSCQNSGSSFKKANGVEVKMLKDAPGKNAALGDIMEMNIVWKVGKNDGKSKDSVIVDTRQMNNGKPISMPLQEAKFRGDMAGGLSLLSAVDSAIIRVSVDSIKKALKDQPLPPFVKEGDYFIYEVSVVSVKTKEESEKEAKERSAKAVGEDDKKLQEYFAANKLTPTKTASGLYYVITKPGSGAPITKGMSVTMNYTGKLMDGTKFDSNQDSTFHHMEPFTFPIGVGQVIPGWDEGVMLLNKGAKATLFIPSGLAYGEHPPTPAIPANSILVFDVVVVSYK